MSQDSIFYTPEYPKKRSKKDPPMTPDTMRVYVDLFSKLKQDIQGIDMHHSKKSYNKDILDKYNYTKYLQEARDLCERIQSHIESDAKRQNIYKKYLANINGVGPLITAKLVAMIGDISKFNTISALWQFAGLGMNRYCKECKKPTYVIAEFNGTKAKRLAPLKVCQDCGGETLPIIQRETSGYMINYNPEFKVLCWNIVVSFIKQASESKYRKLYDEIKHEETLHAGRRTKMHIHKRAIRRVAKTFLADLWIEWRRMEHLPISKPYAISVLGHTDNGDMA